MPKMTDRQRIFCREYLIDMNAAQAAVRAGYKPQNARICACKLIARPHIKAEIKRLMADREKRLKINADEVLNELMAIAKANAAAFARVTVQAGKDGEGNQVEVCRVKIKPTEEIDPGKIAALAGIRQHASGVEVKLYDKLKALELLMRHLGLLNNKTEDKVEISVVMDDRIREWAK